MRSFFFLAAVWFTGTPGFSQGTGTVTVDVSSPSSSFSPMRALGAGVDGVSTGTVNRVYTPANIAEMLSAGYGPLTYRLYTELSVQDWHWNPQGVYSNGNGSGYWTSNRTSSVPISHSHGFNLPRSGFTYDQGTNAGYSRIDDGDPMTFWKSNPYLDQRYTGDPDSSHPQWVMVDLGSKKPVDAIQLNWGNPYATAYQIAYWTGDDPLYSDNDGAWVQFPNGAVSAGRGGTVTIQLATQPVNVEFVRVWMTASSGTCVETPASDLRDCMGYALNEVGIGTVDAGGRFTDLMRHAPNQSQTITYCSSVDPWETSGGEETGEEQPGLDLIFTSGITRGLPAIIPVTLLYGTPENAANELAYVESKGYNVGYVEMGEEPDGQFITPEDYGALYVEWSAALHKVDPNLKLGGPILESDQEVYAWPDANGNTSWLNRFLTYLTAHGRISDLAFMSYEHYPFVPCQITWNSLLEEPAYTTESLATWRKDGLPANVPVFVTESNVTYDFQQQQVALFGALWYSDFVGVFLTEGGSQAYYYEYEPLPLYPSSECNSWGNFGMFEATGANTIFGYDSQYFAAQVLTQQWAEPVDATHYIYSASTSLPGVSGPPLITSYALMRPDGQYAVMLINKDQTNPHAVTVTFHDSATNSNRHFAGNVTEVSFGAGQYIWRPNGALGFATPDGPLATSVVKGGTQAVYTLEPSSINVLRGVVR